MNEIKNIAGFTLVELLITISVIGILSAVILVAINPGEQTAKARDAGKKSAINQLAKGMQNYNTFNSYLSLTPGNTWMSQLVSSGDLKAVPTLIGANQYKCSWDSVNNNDDNGWKAYDHNGYCFWRTRFNYGNSNADPSLPYEASIWTRLETKTEESKCSGNSNPNLKYPYYSWHSVRGNVCMVCGPNYLGVNLSLTDLACNSVQ